MERVLYAPRALPPLPPDVSQDPGPYAAWSANRERERTRRERVSREAALCLVMPVVGVDRTAVRRTLQALRRQSGGWSLTVVAPEDQIGEVRALVRTGANLRHRGRIRVVGAAAPCTMGQLLQMGLKAHPGLPRAPIFPGDVWAPDAVSLFNAALAPWRLVYADEDRERADGTWDAPRFKPDFSYEFLFSSAYVGRPLAMGASVADHLPDLVASDEDGLEHECALAAADVAEDVIHIPEVLCHRSREAPVATSTSFEHVSAALRRREPDASVLAGSAPGLYRIVRTADANIPVSIVIPFRDQPGLLRTCVDSVVETTREQTNVELVLIDNGSTDLETLSLVERLKHHPDIKVVTDARPFNWAALNNAGARQARGEVLLFLNNDIEARRNGWLSALCAQALRPDVAAVGARLLYPDHRLQHCGLVVGLTGAAGHVLGGLEGGKPGYLNIAVSARECSAVTGACLATRRHVFDALDGFDEILGVDLNDVDYCLRAGALGLRTIYEPAAELIHHESPSRGTAGGVGDIVQFLNRWKGYISDGDRYLNPHLTRTDSSCRLAGPDERDDWNRWYATLTMQ